MNDNVLFLCITLFVLTSSLPLVDEGPITQVSQVGLNHQVKADKKQDVDLVPVASVASVQQLSDRLLYFTRGHLQGFAVLFHYHKDETAYYGNVRDCDGSLVPLKSDSYAFMTLTSKTDVPVSVDIVVRSMDHANEYVFNNSGKYFSNLRVRLATEDEVKGAVARVKAKEMRFEYGFQDDAILELLSK